MFTSEDKALRKLKRKIENFPVSDWEYDTGRDYDHKGHFTETYKFLYNKENLKIISTKENINTCIPARVIETKYSVWVLSRNLGINCFFENKGRKIYNFLDQQKKTAEKEKIKQEKRLEIMSKEKIENTRKIEDLKSLESIFA